MLEVRDLNFYIGSAHILRSVSFDVREGEVVCLLGRNGAGKTSTIKCILGLYTPRSGKIIFKGRDITRLPPEKRIMLGLAYSPEDARVFPDLTVEENLKLPVWIRGQTVEMETIFRIFPEIRKLLKRKGLYLSGGEKKMVSISRGIALNPSLLLLDESFEGLAPVAVARFSKALNMIKEMGITILMAESNIRIAHMLADRIYVVERGEIIFQGTPDEVMKNEKLLRVIGR
ncbi:MAG: ABC transporter ATP-binding protein [Candidatus Hecatellaceae archaeon]